uniref:Uncharacterized protein n=1 Tax=viral metagenome TaxID=1070528 RepID=A0A6M3L915_9ZZZZ
MIANETDNQIWKLLEWAESILFFQVDEEGHDYDICLCERCLFIRLYSVFTGTRR